MVFDHIFTHVNAILLFFSSSYGNSQISDYNGIVEIWGTFLKLLALVQEGNVGAPRILGQGNAPHEHLSITPIAQIEQKMWLI